MKTVDSLTVQDLAHSPVWKYSRNKASDQTSVRPVKHLPVSILTGKVVGTQVLLRNGQRLWAIIGNVDPDNARLTQHFLTMSLARNERWFHLARYHDFDYEQRGPAQLASFLGLTIDDVFPISYDLCPYAIGDPLALRGTVPKEPVEKLSRAEIIAKAVP